MNFDELYKLVLEEKKNCKDPCLICHLNMNDEKEIVKLDCSHSYHRNCLFHKKSSKTYEIECPYCRSFSKCNQFINKCIALVGNKKCNRNTFNSNCLCTKHVNYKPNKCIAILSRGKNKGQECGISIPLNEKYCKKHINFSKTSSSTCQAILSRGKNKGKPCGNKIKNENSKYCDKHQNYKPIEMNNTPKLEKIQCQGIIKSGKNKGKQCTSRASQGNYCKRHYVNVNVIENISVVI
ncbi:hypothetical protein CPAV1605_570 [seawater metagenome]|uniref:RING-type domain-containing protein n=1 Tax=seawater metagenome TaxID=1561972 RepID=A0A5E8CLG3_9ZZZZ